MLKAYIDDSHTTETAFVLAGYIAPSEAWAAFSKEWQQILGMKPPLERFKMSEANYWSDEQWNERLPLFYGAIEKHVSAGVSMLIPYPEHRRIFAGKRYATNPYHFAFADIIAQIAQREADLKLAGPIDFIFDSGNGERIANAWDKFRNSAPPEVQALMGKKPMFGDDVSMLPLQAADFLAWWKRRAYEKRVKPKFTTRPAPWKQKRHDLLQLDVEWTLERIQQAYDDLYGGNGRK